MAEIYEIYRVKVMNDEEANDDFPIGMRVLVVDDDPICLLLLENLLRRCQYNGMFYSFWA